MSKYVSAYSGAVRDQPKKKKYISAYSEEAKNKGGIPGAVGYLGANLGLGVAGVGEGLIDVTAAGGDLLRGDTEMAKYRFLDNRTADAQQSLTEWYNPGKGMQFAGDVASGVGQSSVFLLDALVPGLGTGLFFTGITGQSVAGAAQQTGDVGWKELGYGVASGAAEAALGKLVGAGGKVAGKLGSSLTRSTGKAIGQRGVTTALTKATGKKLAGMGWNVAKNTLADAASEFTEEFAAEYIDTSLQILFGIDPNASTSFGEAFRAGAVGLVSGAAMGAPANVYNYNNSVAAGRAVREEGGVDQLLYRAAATVDVLKEQEAQAREKGRTKATVPEDAGLVGKTAAKGKQAVANLGAKITASKTKGYWSKLEKNINAYMNMDEAMRNSDVGDALLGELRGNLFFTNLSYAVEEAEETLKTATDEEITEWLVEVNDKAKKTEKAEANYTVEDFRANKDGILSTVAAAWFIDELRRTATGTENTEKATKKPAQAATSPWDGMADNEDMSGYKAAGEAENALLKAAVNQSVPRGSVQAMLDEFRKGTDLTPEEFAEGWSDGAHIYGRYGLNVDEASPLSRMSPEAREAAMKFGRETEEAERKAAEEKAKAKKKPAAQAGKKGAVVRGEGLNVQKLSDEQYAAYKAAEVLAEVLGTDIKIETKILTNKGKEANGYYKRGTNTIHININALRNGKNVALYTLGHEITHYIKEWSPTKFEAMADFVLEQMGVDAEEAIADKLASLKRLGVVKDTMTVAEANAIAREELVAEGMELVLTDGKVLEELSKTDKSLWEKIRDWFFDIIGQIRRSWQDLNQASKTAQVLKETVESLEEIERLFTEGVREAGERTRTAEAGKTAETEGDIIYSPKAEDGVMIDPASGTAMLSVDDIPKTEQEIDDAVNRLVAKLGVDESRARKWVEDEISLATLILRDDMVEHAHRKADRRLTAIVKNSDYKQGTLDFSNICRKRREYTRMMQRIQQAFPNRRFTAEEFATIRKIMVDEGLEVACGLCYVEDRRQNEGYIAETFQRAVEAWRKGNRDTYYDTKNNVESAYNKGQAKAMAMLEGGDYVPTIADLTTVEGMEKLGKDADKGGHPDILRAWKAFNNARGMSSARLLTNEAEYQRQILKYNKARVKAINDLGGLRVFSFSDFEEFHLIDIIQAVQDCAAMGIKIQFYTKVPSFALLMKDTKAKGNLSLIPKGDLGYEVKNGKRVLVYDPVEGIDFNDPDFEKVARGNPNIGTILVGINDEHIRTAMEDDFIDYIIPFHTGQTEVVRQIKKIGKWQNYKNEQVDKPWESGSKAKPVNVYTDVIAAAEREGDPIRNERQFVERFLKVCEERGLRPRYSRFLNTNAEGKYVYTKGYYKLLLDFKMFDKDGTYLPQEPVIPEFKADLLHDLTKKYVAGEKAKTEAESPAFKRALERVEAEVVGDDEGRMYSIDETPETPDISDSAATDRDLLLAMAEQLVGSEEENRILTNYKSHYDTQKARQARLDELTAEMQEQQSTMMYGESAEKRSAAAKRLPAIYKEMSKISEQLADADRKLTEIEGMKAIRNLLKREYAKAREIQKNIYDTRAKVKREAAETTELRRKTRRIYNRVLRLLVSPNRKRNIPYELQGIAAEALKTANMDLEAMERLEKLEQELTALEREAVPNPEKIAQKEEQIEAQEKKVGKTKDHLQVMIEIFEKAKDIKEGVGRSVYDESALAKLKDLQGKIGNTTIGRMNREQLQALKDFYDILYTRISNANKMLSEEREATVEEYGSKATTEAHDAKSLKFLSPKSMELKGMANIRQFFWKNMKPLTVFEAIGSDTFTRLFQSVLNGENVWARDIEEARKKIVETRDKYGYDKWELDKRVEVKDKDGKTVRLSLSEMMSLYAYAKRKQAMGHLEGGGFVLDPGATEMAKGKVISFADMERRLNHAERHVVDQLIIGEIASKLTAEQKAYVDEMQTYLTKLGERGNTVSRKLYGIDIFTEEYYFPIKVKSEYLESHTGRTGDPNIKNRGMTKEVTPEADNPLVLQGFDDVMVDHIVSMATYHAFVLPVEDLTRVLNYKPSNAKIDEDGNWTVDESRKDYSTLKAVIEEKYGAEANHYIEQLIRDLNGGARRDAAATLLDKGITGFKRASTMASLSVLIQQPTSLIRAAAYIDPKYLFGQASIVDFANHKKLWERLCKYAPVGIIKEMGGYDTGVGARTGDYLNAKNYKTPQEKLEAFFKPERYGGDSNYRAEIFGKGAAYFDEMAWIQMFEACVSEQADKLGKSRDSEEVLKAAGKRFEEVVRRTQVYDSTLTRTEFMRSKDTGMKMATAFMAEPSTVVSMVADAIMKAERGDTAFLRRTAGAVAGAVILNALASSLVYAMRDDDEEKTYGEKYVASVAMEAAEAINPLEYLPYFRDIMSIMKGYEIERTDMTLISNLFQQVELLTSSKRTVGEKMLGVSGAVSAFFGIPMTNITRDAKGIVNTVMGGVDTERGTAKGMSAALKEEFSGIFGLFDEQTKNEYQIYQAYISGDTAHYNRVRARYKSEQAAELALRQALRDNEPRISEAAAARLSGDLAVYESIVDQIESEGIFDRNIVIRAINNEMLDLKDEDTSKLVPKDETVTEEEDETAESLYKASDLNNALERGDTEDFAAILAALMDDKVSTGKTEAQAKASVKSSITAHWKKLYIEAWSRGDTEERKRIIAILTETGLYGNRNDVATLAQNWVKNSK